MGTWNSRGLRGSTLEEMVNRTNEWYLEKGLALMQKIPTPITPVKMDKEHRQITLAYFDQIRATRLPAALIQGQRDFFGSHTYHRVDKEGVFHTLWAVDGRPEEQWS